MKKFGKNWEGMVLLVLFLFTGLRVCAQDNLLLRNLSRNKTYVIEYTEANGWQKVPIVVIGESTGGGGDNDNGGDDDIGPAPITDVGKETRLLTDKVTGRNQKIALAAIYKVGGNVVAKGEPIAEVMAEIQAKTKDLLGKDAAAWKPFTDGLDALLKKLRQKGQFWGPRSNSEQDSDVLLSVSAGIKMSIDTSGFLGQINWRELMNVIFEITQDSDGKITFRDVWKIINAILS